jgi:hypothetical protein
MLLFAFWQMLASTGPICFIEVPDTGDPESDRSTAEQEFYRRYHIVPGACTCPVCGFRVLYTEQVERDRYHRWGA